jgi:glutamate-ammonia-ligase adenylyltransferase
MEHYFQREGRDWERYAWQKARPVAGDLVAGERLLQALRPFVYRRYLDFGALDGLREMKAAIAAEVARKDMADDIKRGPAASARSSSWCRRCS